LAFLVWRSASSEFHGIGMRGRQRLLHLLEQPLVRGVVAEPLLVTANQRLVLGYTRIN